MNHILAFHTRKVAPATRNVVTITFADLALLIPIEDAAKILPLPEVRLSARKVLGLTEIDQALVIVLDLHYPLYGTNSPDLFGDRDLTIRANASSSGYLILLNASPYRQYGLITATLPMIQSVLLDRIETLPDLEADRGLMATNHQTVTQFSRHWIPRFTPVVPVSPGPINPGQVRELPGFLVDVPQMIQMVRQCATG
jgi:hypothetical protein